MGNRSGERCLNQRTCFLQALRAAVILTVKLKKVKRRKQVIPEKPVKKPKSGETPGSSAPSRQNGSGRDDDSMVQTGKTQYAGVNM